MLDTNLSATIKLTRQFLKMMLEASLARFPYRFGHGTSTEFVSSFLGVRRPRFFGLKSLKTYIFPGFGVQGGKACCLNLNFLDSFTFLFG